MDANPILQIVIDTLLIVGVVFHGLPWAAEKVAEAMRILKRASWDAVAKERQARKRQEQEPEQEREINWNEVSA